MSAFVAPALVPRRGAHSHARTSSKCLTSPKSTGYGASTRRVTTPSMSATTDSDISIRLYGNNIKITDSLREYVEKKIGKVVSKYRAYCSKVDVHLTVQPSVPAGQAAEVVIFYKRNIFRRIVRSADMYTSIDEVEAKLTRTLRKYKERQEGKSQKSPSVTDMAGISVELSDESDDDGIDDTFGATGDPTLIPNVEGLVKRKTFPMPLQTVEEAILCLDYIDHSFYMFRAKDSGKVSLVYRRNHGGYGLIEPDSEDSEE